MYICCVILVLILKLVIYNNGDDLYDVVYVSIYISIFLSFGKAHNNGKLNDDEWQNGGSTKGPIFSILKNEVFDRKIQFRIFIKYYKYKYYYI